jgi:hypothetical protein
LAKRRQGAFEQVHLGERDEERERRFGPLVPVEPVLLEAVAAPTGAGVVQILAQIVAAEEPLEGGAGLPPSRPLAIRACGRRAIS